MLSKRRRIFGRRGWHGGVIAVLMCLATLTLQRQPIEAQQLTSYLVGYLDGDETQFGLLGAQLRRGGLGWQPMASLEGYVLGFDQETGNRTTIWAIAPGAGMHYQGEGGAFIARASYQFVVDGDEGVGFFAGGESGPAITLQGLYWGMVPAFEALASYNTAANFLWSQAQAYVPIAAVPPGSIDIGAEYIWQGGLDDADSRAQMFGPLLRWSSGRGVYSFLSGGLKHNLGPGDNTWYARAALVFAP